MFGNFLNALIAFLVLAWVVFMLVKAVNAAKAMASKPALRLPRQRRRRARKCC